MGSSPVAVTSYLALPKKQIVKVLSYLLTHCYSLNFMFITPGATQSSVLINYWEISLRLRKLKTKTCQSQTEITQYKKNRELLSKE